MIWKHARYRAVLIDGDRRSTISMLQGRLSFLAFCFIVGYSLIILRVMDLAIVQGEFYAGEEVYQEKELQEAVVSIGRRGDVYDRNGFLLATTLESPSLYVDPSLVLDAEILAQQLTKLMPDLNRSQLLRTFQAKNRFGWVKRHISPAEQKKILQLGEPALAFQTEYRRVYPQGSLLAHMIGYTDRDGVGLAGIESAYEGYLSKGEDVYLTLDLRLQHIVKREVSTAMQDFNAKAGAGVILDAKTGEVLAGVSLPDFDINLAGAAKDDEKFNRLTLGVYELGSMFKIFSTAALLELHGVSMGHQFDARKPIKIGRFTINDYHAQKRIMTLPEVFMHSSNIGSALMGEMIGGTALQAFYRDLGLLDRMNFDFQEVGKPLVPNPWRKVTTYTASYGHGLATTPLQMSAAVASVVNGGFLVNPTLVAKKGQDLVQVISQDTSEKMRRLLRLVVTHGTGKNAESKGFVVGGKTGTAEKSVNGRYDRGKLISSFVGAFPMDDPRYVVMVMVDEPKGNKKSYGYATAGWVAAPAVSRIVTSMASVMGMPADQYREEEDISQSLVPYLQDEKTKGKQLVSY
ncbi:MAG: penicillin-binding protein 2 [Alphaproteobacteria bacterium]|nr:penicillin-binding protein 2 [Alphaproteobacteria bacterium]